MNQGGGGDSALPHATDHGRRRVSYDISIDDFNRVFIIHFPGKVNNYTNLIIADFQHKATLNRSKLSLD